MVAALAEVDAAIADLDETGVAHEVVQAALAEISEVYAHLQPHEQQELFRLLLERAEVSEHRLVLQIKTGVDPSCGSSPEPGGSLFPPPIWLPEEGDYPNFPTGQCVGRTFALATWAWCPSWQA